MPNAPTPTAAPAAPVVAQWLVSVVAALAANWLCLQVAATSFMLLTALGVCSDSSLAACVVLTSLVPALLAMFALAAAFVVLRLVGVLRGWLRSGVLLALLGFVLGALGHGILAERGALAPQVVGEPTSPLALLEPWLPCLLSGAVLSSWVAWRRRVSPRRAPALRS
jgi:hypothetical protein